MTRTEPQEYLYQFIQELYAISEKNIKVLDLSNVPSEIAPVIIAVTATPTDKYNKVIGKRAPSKKGGYTP